MFLFPKGRHRRPGLVKSLVLVAVAALSLAVH